MKSLEGVVSSSLNFAVARLTVEFDRSVADLRRVVQLARRHGIGAHREGDAEADEASGSQKGRNIAIVASIILLITGAVASVHQPFVGQFLYVAAILTAGTPIAISGIVSLRHGSVGMDLLMTLAVIGGMGIGEWAEAATVAVLFAVAHAIEARAADRARNAVRSLMDLRPRQATVLREGGTVRIDVEEVRVEEIVDVRPGERIPLDGMVIAGTSSVDQSPITGESIPVDKSTDDLVYAGTVNQRGALRFRVTRPASETTFARIIHAIEEAQAVRAPSQQFVDRFARIYTPIVMGIAVLATIVPSLIPALSLGHSAKWWFYQSLIFLVISCPCALVISTPVAVVTALATAARHGVLIKGGLHLENIGAARVVAFDKTGTLTTGRTMVTDVIPVDGSTQEHLLGAAAAIESHSEHPFATAIRDHAEATSTPPLSARDFEALPGRGARASVDGEVHYVGAPRLFDDFGVLRSDVRDLIERLADEGNTVVVVGTQTKVEGLIAIADEIRRESSIVVKSLRDHGVQKVVMLTGDNATTARRIAHAIAIDEYKADLLPEDKVKEISELSRRFGGVVMVGDGINDAPALAAATVGVAMGTAGTDIALETADVALVSDDLTKLTSAVRLGQISLGVIRSNIAFALITKLVFLLLTFFGLTTLWLAVLSDMGASLLVTFNSILIDKRATSVNELMGQ